MGATDPAGTGRAAAPTGRRPTGRTTAASRPASILDLYAGLAPSMTPGQIAAQAAALARSTVAGETAGISAIRNQTLADARQRAADITAASKAGAGLLAPLAGQAQQAYTDATANLLGTAQGFTGQLRTDAADEAARARAAVEAAGGSATQITDASGSLANLLYGLSGKLPADLLAVQGVGAGAAARALPAQTLGYGAQEAAGAYGAGAQAAQQIALKIAEAQGRLPELTQGYVSDLSKQVRDDLSSRRDALSTLSLIQSREAAAARANRPEIRSDGKGGLVAVNPLTGKITQVSTGSSDVRSDGKGGLVSINPYTGKITQVSYGSPDVRSDGNGGTIAIDPYTGKVTQVTTGPVNWEKVSDAKGTYLVDPTTFKKIRVAGPPASETGVSTSFVQAPDGSKWVARTTPDGTVSVTRAPGALGKPKPPGTGSGGLTANSAAKMLRGWHDGTNQNIRVPAIGKDGKPITDADGVPRYVTQTQTTGKKTYPEAVDALVGLGWSQARAVRAANGTYKQGEAGRPYTDKDLAYRVALGHARKDAKSGVDFNDALNAALETGLFPDMAVLYKALLAAYKGKITTTTFFGG